MKLKYILVCILLLEFNLVHIADIIDLPPEWQQLFHVDWTSRRDIFNTIERQIKEAKEEEDLRRIEKYLLVIIQDKNISEPVRKWALRILPRVATEQAVSIIEPWLLEPTYTLEARWAIEGLKTAKVDEVLRTAAYKSSGYVRAGLIESISRREVNIDSMVTLYSILKEEEDPLVINTVLKALGRLGGIETVERFLEEQTQILPYVKCTGQNAILNIIMKEVKNLDANGLPIDKYFIDKLKTLIFSATCPNVKAGAIRLLFKLDSSYVSEILNTQLEDLPEDAQAIVLQAIAEYGGANFLKEVLLIWPRLSYRAQAAFLEYVNWPEAIQLVVQSTQHTNEFVQSAAIRAIGRIGGPQDIPMLLHIAGSGSGKLAHQVYYIISQMPGEEPDRILIALIDQSLPNIRLQAMRALKERFCTNAIPKLLERLEAGQEDERLTAAECLIELASERELSRLIYLLIKEPSPKIQARIDQILRWICSNTQRPEFLTAELLNILKELRDPTRYRIIPLLALIPTRQGLEAVVMRLNSNDFEEVKAAIVALSEWPEFVGWKPLIGFYESCPKELHPYVVEGLIRLLDLAAEIKDQHFLSLVSDMARLKIPSQFHNRFISLVCSSHIPEAISPLLQFICSNEVFLEKEQIQLIGGFVQNAYVWNPKLTVSIISSFEEQVPSQLLEEFKIKPWLSKPLLNLALHAKADSPDGLEVDGAATGDQAAIDGNLDTYWDEEDGASEYILRLRWDKTIQVHAIAIIGYEHCNYAPKDFIVIGDGHEIVMIKDAKYINNFLYVPLPHILNCTELIFKITGYYGGSPAIREVLVLGIE